MAKYTRETYAGEADQYKDRSFKQRLFIIIFGTHTKAGRAFDVVLLIMIGLSVLTVMLESVPAIARKYGTALQAAEWAFTIAFTLEYFARVWVVKHSRRYIFSFFGIIDFLAAIPTYLSLVVAGGQTIAILRVIRLLRVFRVLSMSKYVDEGALILKSLRKSRKRILVFFLGVLILVIIVGSAMYLIEGPAHGYDSIPHGIYWSVVTLTTVGFGDIYPHTFTGRFLASFLMLLGYSIIAIPTGIVGAEMFSLQAEKRSRKRENVVKPCPECNEDTHVEDAVHCHRCGKKFPEQDEKEDRT